MIKKLYYILIRGIRSNWRVPYILHGFAMLLVPKCLYRFRYKRMIKNYNSLSDSERCYIDNRVAYYCNLPRDSKLPPSASQLCKHTYISKQGGSVYFFDTYEYTRYFPQNLRWLQQPGDVFYKLPFPTISKSRLIVNEGETANEVIINQDKVRHFIFIHDPYTWAEKKCMILFRGACHGKPMREMFLRTFINNPLFDIRDTAVDSENPPEWQQKKEMHIYDHLKYRYIMSLEGADVASNLKWVMSSNSVAVMPRPTCETWYMEGKLIPNYHYIEIAADFHDITERVLYYDAHPEEVKSIVEHAHEWVKQFKNKEREDIIALLTLRRYFIQTGQSVD